MEKIELSLLTNPENTEREETHQIHHELRPERHERERQIALAVHRLCHRRAQAENKKRHCECKNPVAQRLQPSGVLTGDPVI